MKQHKVYKMCSIYACKNDDVQDFDVRWDQRFIISKRNVHRHGPGRIVLVKIAGFCSASDCFGFV